MYAHGTRELYFKPDGESSGTYEKITGRELEE